MSSVEEIRHHIRVVEDTSKLTRAMYLISSAKMKRALRMHDQNLQYFDEVRATIAFILQTTDFKNRPARAENRYFCEHGQKACYLVIAGDKGMCGGYNSDVLKLALQSMTDGKHTITHVFTVGHKSREFFLRQGIDVDAHFMHISQNPTLYHARRVVASLIDLFISKQADEVYIVYTTMKKNGERQPVVQRLLPMLVEDFEHVTPLETDVHRVSFMPSAVEVVRAMVPHYLIGIVYSALVQSYASENRARMSAMDNATRNANDMLAGLRIEMNHVRQNVITQEITEIISGAPEMSKM